MVAPSISKFAAAIFLIVNLANNSVALPTNAISEVSTSLLSKRVDGDGDTLMSDPDQNLPPPVSGPSYADWMKHLYDMGGGKVRRTDDSVEARDDFNRYKTTVSQDEIDT